MAIVWKEGNGVNGTYKYLAIDGWDDIGGLVGMKPHEKARDVLGKDGVVKLLNEQLKTVARNANAVRARKHEAKLASLLPKLVQRAMTADAEGFQAAVEQGDDAQRTFLMKFVEEGELD